MKCLNFDFQIDEFLVYCRSTQLRPKTLKSYEQTLRLFQRWCMEQQGLDAVDRVSESVVRHYIQDLQERGKYSFYSDDSQKATNFPERRRDYRKPVNNTTINNYIRNLRVFFNWLDREDLLRKNPMKKIRQLKANRTAKEYLEDEEMRRLLSKLDRSYFSEHRGYMMTLLMLDTGMRLGECSSLLVDDLELSRRRINLRSEETKGRASRTVFLVRRRNGPCVAGSNLRTDTQKAITYFQSGRVGAISRWGTLRPILRSIFCAVGWARNIHPIVCGTTLPSAA